MAPYFKYFLILLMSVTAYSANDPLIDLIETPLEITINIDQAIVGERSRITIIANNLDPWTSVSIEGFNHCNFGGFRENGLRDYFCTPVEVGQKILTVKQYDIPLYKTTITVTENQSSCPDQHEPNNHYTTSTEISYSAVQLHSICPSVDQDWFKLTLPSPLAVKAFTFSTTGSDTRLELYNSMLQLIDSNDDRSISDLNSLIDRSCNNPLRAGTYYYKVDAYQSVFSNPSIIPAYLMEILVGGCPDNDNDGIPNSLDKFPEDATEWDDNDDDGQGDNADLDDDNDHLPDLWELRYGLNPLDSNDALFDNDSDGFINIDEYNQGTNPLQVNYLNQQKEVLNRATISKAILIAKYGSGYIPINSTGTIFTDVKYGSFSADWIEQLAIEGITEGCSSNKYCPNAAVTKEQLSKILLKAKHGKEYNPPSATGVVFSDILANDFSAKWIEALSNQEVVDGCGNNNFCPKEVVTIEDFEVMLNKLFP